MLTKNNNRYSSIWLGKLLIIMFETWELISIKTIWQAFIKFGDLHWVFTHFLKGSPTFTWQQSYPSNKSQNKQEQIVEDTRIFSNASNIKILYLFRFQDIRAKVKSRPKILRRQKDWIELHRPATLEVMPDTNNLQDIPDKLLKAGNIMHDWLN